MPRKAGHTPTRARTSEDLPEAEGPITPSPCPACSAKVTSCTTSRGVPGGATLTPSTLSPRLGAGSACGWPAAGIRPSSSDSRAQDWRACTKPFQLAMASSAGASARETRIEEAMMMPAVARLLITSQAPSASTPDCRAMRKTLEPAPKPPATSETRCWASM